MKSPLFAAAAALCLLTACDGGIDLPGTNKVSVGALKKAATDPRVERFYEARQWQPAWNSGRTRELMEALDGAERHGLDAARFRAMVEQAPNVAGEEAALTLAAIAYAETLAMGQIDPKKVFDLYTLPRPKVDVVAGLQKAVEADNLGGWLESLAPQDAEYKAMSGQYVALMKQIREIKAAPVPHGEAIKPGAQDPRVPAIAQALTNAGFLKTRAGALYDANMVRGIKGLQAEAGLKSDGVIGNETIDALNTVLSDHAQQLALNMERRRWLSRDVAETRIDVNTAAALMNYYRGGDLAHSARVVVGKRGDETPQLASNMFQLVANPPWNVPQGIAEEEILPKGAAYMASQGMSMVDGRVVQKPGPKAALGLVKFDLDNKHAIYLHDTPSKAAFDTLFRHKSHGCVRVHNAVDFARRLARDNDALSEFDRKLASGETSTVALKEEMPVRLLYHTVFVDNAGQLVYLPDPYGWDKRLADALGLKAPKRYQTDDDTAVELGP
ncbi:MAG TPA: L,D-transpeptidase family protein [Caulobacteraceae bacterium]|nr:L,D-transpeptidase family protein [Caulobacteraceae bacterium]